MINEEIKKIIENNPVAFATVDNKHRPNVIAVAYIKVVSKNKILITDNYMKKTRENISINNNVCLAVWDKNWKGYKFVGKAKYFARGKWHRIAKKIPENKRESCKGAILVTVSKIKKLA